MKTVQYPSALPCGKREETVHKIAAKALKEYSPRGQSAFQMLEHHGISLFEHMDASTSREFFIVHPAGETGKCRLDCFLDKNGYYPHDRWYAAVALGHYYLHVPAMPQIEKTGMTTFHAGTGDDDKLAVYEAMWFAAAYLMPVARFAQDMQAVGGNTRMITIDHHIPSQVIALWAKRHEIHAF